MKNIAMAIIVGLGLLALTGCVEVETIIAKNPTCDAGRIPHTDWGTVIYDRATDTISICSADSNGNIDETYASIELADVISGKDVKTVNVERNNKVHPLTSSLIYKHGSYVYIFEKDGKIVYWALYDSGDIKTYEILNLRKYLKGRTVSTSQSSTKIETQVVTVFKTNVVSVTKSGEMVSTLPLESEDKKQITRQDLFDQSFDNFFHMEID